MWCYKGSERERGEGGKHILVCLSFTTLCNPWQPCKKQRGAGNAEYFRADECWKSRLKYVDRYLTFDLESEISCIHLAELQSGESQAAYFEMWQSYPLKTSEGDEADVPGATKARRLAWVLLVPCIFMCSKELRRHFHADCCNSIPVDVFGQTSTICCELYWFHAVKQRQKDVIPLPYVFAPDWDELPPGEAVRWDCRQQRIISDAVSVPILHPEQISFLIQPRICSVANPSVASVCSHSSGLEC